LGFTSLRIASVTASERFHARSSASASSRAKSVSGTDAANRIAFMMAKLAGHVWSFDELFDAVLGQP